jgi:uncharacterized protein
MPVRSLHSSVFKWPDRNQVDLAARAWAERITGQQSGLLAIGYFGSYARGDWGVGSDLDLVAVVTDSAEPFERRSLLWDLNELPVPSTLLVYTVAEWKRMKQEGSRFVRTLGRETVWIYRSGADVQVPE